MLGRNGPRIKGNIRRIFQNTCSHGLGFSGVDNCSTKGLPQLPQLWITSSITQFRGAHLHGQPQHHSRPKPEQGNLPFSGLLL